MKYKKDNHFLLIAAVAALVVIFVVIYMFNADMLRNNNLESSDQPFPSMSTSDDTENIEADLEATELENIDRELETIEAELDAEF